MRLCRWKIGNLDLSGLSAGSLLPPGLGEVLDWSFILRLTSVSFGAHFSEVEARRALELGCPLLCPGSHFRL